jgi:hypothetical protein
MRQTRKRQSLKLRIKPEERALIDRAAKMLGKNRTDWHSAIPSRPTPQIAAYRIAYSQHCAACRSLPELSPQRPRVEPCSGGSFQSSGRSSSNFVRMTSRERRCGRLSQVKALVISRQRFDDPNEKRHRRRLTQARLPTSTEHRFGASNSDAVLSTGLCTGYFASHKDFI